jgi:hypothetical protein
VDRLCSPVRGPASMAMPWSPKGLPDRTRVRRVSLQGTNHAQDRLGPCIMSSSAFLAFNKPELSSSVRCSQKASPTTTLMEGLAEQWLAGSGLRLCRASTLMSCQSLRTPPVERYRAACLCTCDAVLTWVSNQAEGHEHPHGWPMHFLGDRTGSTTVLTLDSLSCQAAGSKLLTAPGLSTDLEN